MDKLAYTALAGILQHGQERTRLSHQMANVTTPGFKKSSGGTTTFQKVVGDGVFDTRYQPVAATKNPVVLISPGPVMETGNPYDISMGGATVLGVQGADGNTAFTRRGDLRINAAGIVETGNGYPVLGDGGGPLVVPPGVRIYFAEDGGVFAANRDNREEQPARVGQLMLRDASNERLVRRFDGFLEPIGRNGNGGDFDSGPEKVVVVSESLEGSNVTPVEVLTSLMEFNRSFETQIKVIKQISDLTEGADDLMGLRS